MKDSLLPLQHPEEKPTADPVQKRCRAANRCFARILWTLVIIAGFIIISMPGPWRCDGDAGFAKVLGDNGVECVYMPNATVVPPHIDAADRMFMRVVIGVVIGTNRGVTAHLVVVDEFLFVDPELFKKIVTPLMLVAHTALLCMSTVSDKNADEFDDMTNDNAGMFKTFNYSFVCDKCRALQITTECKHIRLRLPPWHSERRHAMVQKMLEKSKDDLARETLNVAVGGGGVFGKTLVQEWWALPRIDPTTQMPRFVVVSVDPANGPHSRDAAPQSEFAVVATWYDGRHVICGVDSYPVSEMKHWVHRLRDFLAQIRAMAPFERIPIVAVPENMTGTEASTIEQIFLELPDVFVLRENDYRPGLPSNSQIKRDMMVATKIKMQARSIRTCTDEFIACTGDKTTTLAKLKQQLLDYSEIRKAPKEPGGQVRFSYTGKAKGPDDLATMLQFNIFATEIHIKAQALV